MPCTARYVTYPLCNLSIPTVQISPCNFLKMDSCSAWGCTLCLGDALTTAPVNLAPNFFLRPTGCTCTQRTPWLCLWRYNANVSLDWWYAGCSGSGSDGCSVPIEHRLSTTPNTAHYAEYRLWAHGDTVLDWDGAEDGQGRSSSGVMAAGSATVWTTNDHSNTPAYHRLNKYDTSSSKDHIPPGCF